MDEDETVGWNDPQFERARAASMAHAPDKAPETLGRGLNERLTDAHGRRYWRSLDELENTPQFQEFLHREFPEGAAEMLSPFTRRAFLNLMGASIALAGGLTGCRRPEHKILPYAKAPENVLPGIPKYYATTMERAGAAVGLIVECHDGRPTKIEGNPDHPGNLGAVDPITQAEILELYDPDRSTGVLHENRPATREQFDAFAGERFSELRRNGGAGLHILGELKSSPSFRAVRERFQADFPRSRWHVWEPVNEDNVAAGTALALGRAAHPAVDFENADVVLALGSDFLASGPTWMADARRFARRRVPEGERPMNRLYAVEGAFTLTGAMADHRLRLAPSQIPLVALVLMNEISGGENAALAGPLLANVEGLDVAWLQAVARDVAAHPGRAAVLVGAEQPPAVHAAAAVLNGVIGSECVAYRPYPNEDYGRAGRSIAELAAALEAGEVDTLVILGGNPVYDAPADLNFAERLSRAAHVIHLSYHVNETSRHGAVQWHVPRAHALEAWGDTMAFDGTVALQQPMIAPIYDGLSDAELMALLGGQPLTRGYDILRAFHRGDEAEGPAFEARWEQMLHDGLVPGTAGTIAALGAPAAGSASVGAELAEAASAAAPTGDAMELIFQADHHLFDGRYANNGWLQEAPDPVTRISWDNAALISPATAEALRAPLGTYINIEVDGQSVKIPAWTLPGMADNVVVVRLGYGRADAGRVAEGVGFNVYPLRTLAGLHVRTGVKVTRAGGHFDLANTQDHWSIEGRPIYRQTTGALYAEHPLIIKEMEAETPSHNGQTQPFREFEYDGEQWGMAIDLSTCIGCNACLVACQAENNIPIVGREQVNNGREMHWIRVDRYFSGQTLEDVEMVFQPMPCQHCENAPCEQVCPVAATTHSPDGLNEMTYNRCVGTRYCSNNCPYKVRRFNFFNYHEDYPDLLKMASNPNVTVRMRGVMEKCTYCVQRIRRDQLRRRGTDEPYREGSVRTACQTACPTEAIVFGNINDETSLVARAKRLNRNYEVMGNLNFRPRTSYLARLRNPNPELEA